MTRTQRALIFAQGVGAIAGVVSAIGGASSIGWWWPIPLGLLAGWNLACLVRTLREVFPPSPLVRVFARENGGPWVDVGVMPAHRFEPFTQVYAGTRVMATGVATAFEFKSRGEKARPN